MQKQPVPDLIQDGPGSIAYTIHYSSQRKTIAIEISPDRTVRVLAPQRVTKKYIQELVGKKAAWIRKKIGAFEQVGEFTTPRKYVTGETFLYLGEPYRLVIHNSTDRPSVRIINDQLDVALPVFLPTDEYPHAVRAALIEWYRDHALAKIEGFVVKYAGILCVPVPLFKVKLLKRRLGSCSATNNLNFNLNLITAPEPLIEYVVAHELCHFRHKNHSARFWAHVGTVMPDYKERRRDLRKEGLKYVI
jgi:predicted metal-dependent hydrolase